MIMQSGVGVALNGVVYFTAATNKNIDPFYPAVYNGVTDIEAAKETTDECIGHPGPQLLYHYHFMPPCVANSTLYKAGNTICTNITACASDPRTYSENIFTAAGKNNLQPIGIGKDGFIIYGPYDSNGNLWDDCAVDVCNGLWIDG